MDYKKLGLSNGDVLRAEHIAHIEDGVEAALKKQFDYNQHDATASDFIKNRPFWPEKSPVLFSMLDSSGYPPDEDYNDITTPEEISGSLVPPVEGKRYTFGTGVGLYSGIAKRGYFEMYDREYYGIGIIAEQDSNVFVFYSEDIGYPRYYFNLPRSDFEGTHEILGEAFGILIAIIEGDSFCNRLSAADDAISMGGIPEGVSIVQDLTELNKKVLTGDKKAIYSVNALIYDVEITFDMDGTEYTLPSANLTFVANTNLMGFDCDLYMYGQAPLAGVVHDGDRKLLALLDVKTVMGAGPTTKAFKVNCPGIFAPTVPAKKLSKDLVDIKPYVVYIPINYLQPDGTTITNFFYADPLCTQSADAQQLYAEFEAGRPVYLCQVQGTVDLATVEIKKYYAATCVHARFIYRNGVETVDRVYLGFMIEGTYHEVYRDAQY